jgi:hypothetical protein
MSTTCQIKLKIALSHLDGERKREGRGGRERGGDQEDWGRGLTQTNVIHSHTEFITLQPINFVLLAYQSLFSL